MGIKLFVVAGPDAGRQLDVEDMLEIGRESDDVAGQLADDPQLSRHHALIRYSPDGSATIEDLGSSNGTTVNGHPVTARQPLRAGDVIEVGSSVVEVRGDSLVQSAPSPPSA